MAPIGSNEKNNPSGVRKPAVYLLRWVSLFSIAYYFLCQDRAAVVNAFSSTAHVALVTTVKSHSYRRCSHRHNCHNILSIPEASFLTKVSKKRIAENLIESGIWDENTVVDVNGDNNTNAPSQVSQPSCQSTEILLLLARDFVDRPEVFSSLLRTDFGFPTLVAHQTRALVMAAIRGEQEQEPQQDGGDENIRNSNASVYETTNISISNPNKKETLGHSPHDISNNGSSQSHPTLVVDTNNSNDDTIGFTFDDVDGVGLAATHKLSNGVTNAVALEERKPRKPKTYTDQEFRSSIVNEKAKRRKRSIDNYGYGLPRDYAKTYPKLASELDDFYTFMTQPSTYSQESPIRDATAKVYLNHAKLFLGWRCQQNATTDDEDSKDNKSTESVSKGDVSIFSILPTKEKESANDIIRYVLWMRSREISVSYEANLLRGITKLLKFRFAKESNSDPLDGKNTFDDIPVIKEIRKLHRDANQRQRLAPRSSDESKKWITWQEYLSVAENTKGEVLELIRKYEALPLSKRRYAKGDSERVHTLEQVRVAEAYQRYLILAILASIPDRQRTIRELEVGRTLMKDAESDCWVVKHGPADYKTGKHYGERPAMQLAKELTPAIDDFLENWRPALKPSTSILLVQSRTGKPMTSNSIFKRVVRSCFKYTGKSVNPHLLRDIIVTHVRETEASEKELEALALYMGHSIQMQRTSYDRRTLSTKVAPAVKLMQSVNRINGA